MPETPPDDVAEDQFESGSCEVCVECRIDDVFRECPGDQRWLAEIKGIKQPASADLPKRKKGDEQD